MASLHCHNCEGGMYYHDEPCDMEYTIFMLDYWERWLRNVYDPDNLKYCKDGSPCQYTSDTIFRECEGHYHEFWKCPDCGTFHYFGDDSAYVTRIYVPCDFAEIANVVTQNDDKKIVFDDYVWFDICESALPVSSIANRYQPSYYVRMTDDYMIFYTTKAMNEPALCFVGKPVLHS